MSPSSHTFSLMAEHAPELMLNCTHHDVHVLVGGGRLRLPRGPVPAIVDTALDADELQFTLDPDGELSTSLICARAVPRLVLLMPEPTPGVRFLVAPDILLRHPERTDLCTPALYAPLDHPTPPVEDLVDEPRSSEAPPDEDAPVIDDVLLAEALTDDDMSADLESSPTYLAAVYTYLDLVSASVATLPPDEIDPSWREPFDPELEPPAEDDPELDQHP